MTRLRNCRTAGGFAVFGFGTTLALWAVMEVVVMTGTRGLLLALTLVAAAPAAAAETPINVRDEAQRQNDPRIQRGRPDPRDNQDYRGGWERRGAPRVDFAFRTGEEDGYKEGLHDGERGDRFDPVREKRYRSGDHGYDRRYGPKELYKDRYRDGFRRGYEDGYQDGRRYGRNNRNDRRNQPSRWWEIWR